MLSNSQRIQVFGELIQRVDTTENVVALTFDDGPTPGDTEAVLQILADRDETATFFLNGSAMHEHPLQAQAIVATGYMDGRSTTQAATVLIIDSLTNAGYIVVTVDELTRTE